MRIIPLILFFSPLLLPAQGFIQLEKFDFSGASYANLNIENDTISIIGWFNRNDGEESGLYFQKLDSFGQVITQKTFSLPDKLYWAKTPRWPFLKLKNHLGYAVLGNFHPTSSGYLLRFDEEGNFLSLKEYPVLSGHKNYAWLFLKETESGLLAGVSSQLDNFDVNSYLYKLDYEGNIIWVTELGTPLWDIVSDVVVKSENEYIVAASSNTNTSIIELIKNGTQIWKVDSTGLITDYWEGALDDSEGGAFDIQPLADGGIIYHTAYLYKYLDIGYFSQAKMVRRTSNYEIVWERLYGRPAENYNNSTFRDMKAHPLGGYVAVGHQKAAGIGNYTGYMIRTDGDGVLGWERLDSAHVDDQWRAVGFLSSGNIIACGSTNNDNDQSTYSWLIKVSPDGCVDTLNCAIVDTETPVLPSGALRVFPNPASTAVQVEYPATAERGYWQLWDMYGQAVRSEERHMDTGTGTLSVDGLPPGGYLLTIRTTRGVMMARVVVI